MSRQESDSHFQVAPWVHRFGGVIERYKAFWIKLGNFETRVLREEVEATPIQCPVFITGLARSGTTILLEILSQCPGFVSHRYKDFPPLYTPYWWNAFLDRVPQNDAVAIERSHGDGILVTPDSPEAMEEVLWMAFFSHLHDPAQSNVLNAKTDHPKFERFLKDHIRKLLLVRGGDRYVSKGNYNISRIDYLLKLFPDARFVIPVRYPVQHIASLVRQQTVFTQGVRNNPRALEHLRRVGHFEFGPVRRPINLGDQPCIDTILQAWQSGEDIKGWALYWSHIYGSSYRDIMSNPKLRQACLLVRYEDLCAEPKKTLNAIMEHCRIESAQSVIESFSDKLCAPAYYQPSFTDEERTLIEEATQKTAALLGYG